MAEQQVKNYLVESILVTICCCLPLGIVGIIFAAQVNGKLAAGDYEGAVESANQARKWTMIGFWIGLIANLLIIGVQVMAVVGGVAAS